jgi:ABC-type tungstate transport system permease subunit
MAYRVGITTNKGRIEALNFESREQVDDFILSFDKEEVITHYRIEQDNIFIETEKGRQ